MPTTFITPDQDAIVSEFTSPPRPSRVFQALTEVRRTLALVHQPGMPGKVLGNGRSPRRPLQLRHRKRFVEVNNVSEFECHGEILEYDPPRVLVYTWLAKPKHWGSLWKDSTKASRFFVSSLLSISFSGIGLP